MNDPNEHDHNQKTEPMSRRAFMQTSAAATVTLAAAPLAVARIANAAGSDGLRVGLTFPEVLREGELEPPLPLVRILDRLRRRSMQTPQGDPLSSSIHS